MQQDILSESLEKNCSIKDPIVLLTAGENDFWVFNNLFLKSELKTPDFHKAVIELFDNPNIFVALAAPRGHAKTTVASIRHNLWMILYAKEPYILQVSETYSHACDVLSAIKYKLDSPVIKMLYGVQYIKECEDDLTITTHFGRTRIKATGKGGQIRGLISQDEHRPSFIVCDDLEKTERADNIELRDKDWTWFWKELVPARSRTGRIRVIGTILHQDSLLARLMKLEDWSTCLYDSIIDERECTTLWPEHMKYDELMNLKEKFKLAGQLHTFFAEYRNNPIDPENAEFQRNWIRRTTLNPERLKDLIITSTWDLAITKKDSACYTAAITCAWGRTTPSNIYLLDSRRGRWDIYETIDQIHQVAMKYRPNKIGIEKGSLKNALDPVIQRERQKDFEHFNIVGIPAVGDKDARIRAAFTPFAMGQVWFVGDHPELEEELTTFPGSLSKDMMDAWAMQLWLHSVSPDPEPKPVKQDSGEWLINKALKRNKRESDYLHG